MENNQFAPAAADMGSLIIEFESGNLSDADTVTMFQTYQDTLINLQGFYGRTLKDLIDNGYVTPTDNIKKIFGLT